MFSQAKWWMGGGVCMAGLAHAGVDFLEPLDGAVVEPSFMARFQVTGLEVAPSSDTRPGTGHHHLFINAVDIEKNVVIPNDNQHKHYGKGQTEAEVFLQPGKYTLTLQFGDSMHKSYGPEYRKKINITVVGKP
jgi:hypothetical protein